MTILNLFLTMLNFSEKIAQCEQLIIVFGVLSIKYLSCILAGILDENGVLNFFYYSYSWNG